jgi:hypothetical protein
MAPSPSGPQLAGPQLGGPQLGGPQLGGPQLGGPQLAGPQLGGPQLGGPQLGGPQLGGPQLGGPQLGGPQLGGPQLGGYAAAAPPAPMAAAPMAAAPMAAAPMAAAPIEPFNVILRSVLLIFGVMLVVTFVAPWLTQPTTVMSWDVIAQSKETSGKLLPIFIAAAGLLSFALGLLPAPLRARGLGAVAAGFLVFAAFAVAIGSRGRVVEELGWRGYLLLAAMLTAPAALLLRGKYPASLPARLLGAVAGVATLLVFLVPLEGQIPLKALKELTAVSSASMKVAGFGGYLIFAAGASALVTWMPASASPMTGLLAWLNILAVPVLIGAGFVLAGGPDVRGLGAQIVTAAPAMSVYPIVWLAGASALVGYGLAALLGKAHERG